MSLQHFEKITCPQCQKNGTFLMHESVNVSLDPEYKEKILDGSLFLFTCPACGTETFVEYGFLYHDMDKQLMILVCGSQEAAEKATFFSNPMIGNLTAGYKFRTVVGTRQLAEKIRIFESGLDDFAIEMIKASLWEYIDGEKTLFFDNIENGNLRFIVCFDDGSYKGFQIPDEKYEQCKQVSDSWPQKENLQYVDAMCFLFEEDE